MTAYTQFSVRRLLALAYARVNKCNLAHKRDKSCTRISCANEPCLAQCNNDWYPYDGLTRKIYALVCVTYRVLTWGSLISKQVMYWNFMRYEPCPAWYNNDINRYEGRNGRRASCSTWGGFCYCAVADEATHSMWWVNECNFWFRTIQSWGTNWSFACSYEGIGCSHG